MARGPLRDSTELTRGTYISLWVWVISVPVDKDVLIHREDTGHGFGASVRGLEPTSSRAGG